MLEFWLSVDCDEVAGSNLNLLARNLFDLKVSGIVTILRILVRHFLNARPNTHFRELQWQMKKTVPFLNVIPQSGSGTKTFIYYRVHRLKWTAALARSFPRCICPWFSFLKVGSPESQRMFCTCSWKALEAQQIPPETERLKARVAKSEPRVPFIPFDNYDDSKLASTFNWKESQNREQLILQPLCRV